MLDFNVKTELLDDETRVVSVSGELDMYTAPPFQEQIYQALDDGQARLVVDLSGCELLDSTALGILVTANSGLGEQNDRLVVVAANRDVARSSRAPDSTASSRSCPRARPH